MVQGRARVRDTYASEEVADGYCEERFASAWGAVLHGAQVAALNRVIRQHRVRKVLEIAPGPARLSTEVVGFERGYLCEASAAMLRVARQRLTVRRDVVSCGRWRAVQGDAFALPFRGPFDLVYAFRFLRHFQTDDRTNLLGGIRSVLRPDGLLVFDAVNRDVAVALRAKDPESYPVFDHLYTVPELTAELTANGFRILTLIGVTRHAALQHTIQVLVAPRALGTATRLIRLVERVPGRPLEWVVVCQVRES